MTNREEIRNKKYLHTNKKIIIMNLVENTSRVFNESFSEKLTNEVYLSEARKAYEGYDFNEADFQESPKYNDGISIPSVVMDTLVKDGYFDEENWLTEAFLPRCDQFWQEDEEDHRNNPMEEDFDYDGGQPQNWEDNIQEWLKLGKHLPTRDWEEKYIDWNNPVLD